MDWESVSGLENNRTAYSFSAYYQRFAVEKFKDSVALVEWTLYPEGRYFMDEDGTDKIELYPMRFMKIHRSAGCGIIHPDFVNFFWGGFTATDVKSSMSTRQNM